MVGAVRRGDPLTLLIQHSPSKYIMLIRISGRYLQGSSWFPTTPQLSSRHSFTSHTHTPWKPCHKHPLWFLLCLGQEPTNNSNKHQSSV